MEQVTILQTQYLNRVFARLFSARPQSMAIISDWQIGKSTLLNQIIDPSVFNQYKPEHVKPLFFLYDIEEQQVGCEQLLERMTNDLAKATGAQVPEGNYYHALQELVKELQETYCIYYLFANFELLTQNPQVPLEFYSFLRSLANSYRLAFITTSKASLQSLCARQDICESPFFNIFTNLDMKGFSEEDTAKLIKETGLAVDAGLTFALCGGHPGLTGEWIQYVSEHGADKDAFINAMKDYTEQWLKQFDKDTLGILEAISQKKPVPASLKYIEDNLRRKGYLNATGQIASEVFRMNMQNRTKTVKAGLFQRIFGK